MLLRTAQAIVLLVGLAGCLNTAAGLTAACLEDHPGDIRCCEPGGHIDHGICCGPGQHAVADVEHLDWKNCAADEDPSADAGGSPDAGADAP